MAARKRCRLEDFQDHKKKSQEAELEEKTQLSQLLFRFIAGTLLTLLLILLAGPSSTTHTVARAMLLFLAAGLTVLGLSRVDPSIFTRSNQLILLIVLQVLLYQSVVFMHARNGWSLYLVPLP